MSEKRLHLAYGAALAMSPGLNLTENVLPGYTHNITYIVSQT